LSYRRMNKQQMFVQAHIL